MLYAPLGPSRPKEVELSAYLEHVGVYAVVPLVVGVERAAELPWVGYGVVAGALYDVELVVVGVAVVGLEIDIPMTVDTEYFGCTGVV